MNDYIEQLAAQKPFDALTAEEREIVLPVMSRESYEQTRAIILAAPALDAGLEPPLALRDALIRHMKTIAPARRPVWARPIPVWQAAAALLGAVILAGLLQWDATGKMPAPVVELRIDTVYVPTIEWKERVLIREKIVYQLPKTSPPAAAPDPPKGIPLSETPDFPGSEPPASPIGASLGSQPELLDFFAKIRR